jgi:CBS domain-containing protein
MKHRTVANVMTPAETVVSVHPGTPYKEIVRLLTEHQISALPVLGDAGRVLGVVSEADLLPKESRSQQPPPARSAFTSREAQLRHKAEADTALELMTAPAITITAEEDVSKAARRLETHRIKRLPVVDETGRLVGIVSRRDILRIFLRTDQELLDEARALLVDDFWIAPDGWTARVEGGTLHLTGCMDRRSTVRIAESAVRHIDGIVAVQSELTYEVDDAETRPTKGSPYRGIFTGHHHSH